MGDSSGSMEKTSEMSESGNVPQGHGIPGQFPASICPTRFDGTNYMPWSRSFQLAVDARGLQGYLEGGLPLVDGDQRKWKTENSLVMSWLLNSMQPGLARGYLFLDTTSKIWEAVKETYSQVGNDAQLYELRKKVHSTTMTGMSLAQYWTELSGLWQELDYYQDLQASCALDAVKFQRLQEKERVFDFLAGLL